jgi:gliding motility-associated-like protein
LFLVINVAYFLNKFLQHIFLLAFTFITCREAQATHIVGGDITYRHIIDDSFEVKLILYVDCAFGSQQAIALDTNAMIAVFDSSNTLIKTLLNYRSAPVRVNSVNYNCVAPPSNACVDKYIYTYYTSLPNIPGGYVIAFQRCCRNNSISNILTPGQVGATYWIHIPDTSTTSGYNSSAEFNSLPPNFLCVGRDFIYNHTASDADGDSLVYGLYQPFIGADFFNNLPRPPSPPPYSGVSWASGFGTPNMMKGNPELSIDSLTGVLKVKPQFTGQYVVGILVKEYRNGKYINAIRRDFQFNVFNCQFDVVSAFSKDIHLCSDTVKFVNQSVGATSYLWDFGDTLLNIDSSTLAEPTYIYTATGAFMVKLVATKGNCKDSILVRVTIDKDIGSFAGEDQQICKGDSLVLGTENTGNFSYSWFPADYLDNPASGEPIAKPPVSISYIATRATDVCVNRDTVNIFVPNIGAGFVSHFNLLCQDALLKIDSPEQVNSDKWLLDGVAMSRDEVIQLSYQFNKSYVLQFIVEDSGCVDTASKIITPYINDSLIMVYNVFTPNKDGLNECLSIRGLILEKDCSRIFIYNRWGELLFDSNKDGTCFDGSVKGNPLSQGVYYYILEHYAKKYTGSITLLR